MDILSHIFEQSITDLERLRQSLTQTFHANVAADGSRRHLIGRENAPTAVGGYAPSLAGGVPAAGGKTRSRRKQEGAVYTPAFITRYLVEQALGGVVKQRFETLRQKHEKETTGTARKALIGFWEAWQEELKRLRILDLACGKQLTSLDHTIREGNSVISDSAVHPKAFDWQAAFPEVLAQAVTSSVAARSEGGFDVVVGNPPYIRQELLASFKPYWEQ